MVLRIFVEKKKGMDVEAEGLFSDLREGLGLRGLKRLRILNRYDVSGLTQKEFKGIKAAVFYEPAVDTAYDETFTLPKGAHAFAVEYLPGQYDQRADSAAQCVQLIYRKDRPEVRTAKVYILEGDISEADLVRIKGYLINPVDSREADMEKPHTLEIKVPAPAEVPTLDGFNALSDGGLMALDRDLGLAMKFKDLKFCQDHFKKEGREPTLAEIRIIDTYWSDHCRHTTFLTAIDSVEFGEGTRPYEKTYKEYLKARKKVYGRKLKEKGVSLMDIATLAARQARAEGLLPDLDESEEINACSIRAKIDVDGEEEDYLIMFKNETHNHPTEIEPYGGAATCLGGAIRDPLSGRSYVYHAMRVTGSGDPTAPYEKTIEGKLPQKKITTEAAHGYSAYGNQIGLATGVVDEIYHEGYIAKRMEIGAVVGAAPAKNVVREKPQPGDAILLIGGRTGRDGCGGATGSSKAHDETSIMACGAEVQKGNPITERKLQRLFRNPAFSRLVKRCNDFGAGGVSVAVGELAPGLDINLDAIPKKYEGLDGIELAISESQERMAVVIAQNDIETAASLCAKENLECTHIADVTDTERMRMHWRGKCIADIPREFLNTNGIKQHAIIRVSKQKETAAPIQAGDLQRLWLDNLSSLNVCSQAGLRERFDGSIGAGTVLMPHGGRKQATPVQAMAAKLPAEGETDSATLMAWGFDPYLCQKDPYIGAAYAITDALCKITASGGDYKKCRLTLQEYFEKLGDDPEKWAKPFLALLGAWKAQREFATPAIGGKDSMSGTFKDLSVPPTLVAFALCVADAREIISPEFKNEGNTICHIPAPKDRDGMPQFGVLKKIYDAVRKLIKKGEIVSAWAVGQGGIAAGISKMCFGNGLGFESGAHLTVDELFAPEYGSLLLEIKAGSGAAQTIASIGGRAIGLVSAKPAIRIGSEEIGLNHAYKAWEKPLEGVFRTKTGRAEGSGQARCYTKRSTKSAVCSLAKPRVVITVFPGTNTEYDSAAAFEKAGAIAQIVLIRNLSAGDIEQSITQLKKTIDGAQIVMIPGGFSAGDEPDGSGKFITAVFRNPMISDAVYELLNTRDGLMLGICNGFQALIKLGLVPYGDIRDMKNDSPTLTYNSIGRHVSRIVRTRVTSVLSPWLSEAGCGETYLVPVSHGEGRFIATEEEIRRLFENGQVATQYADFDGRPSLDCAHNPNGSMYAIEGITSPDGRIFGKMGHCERTGSNLYKNVAGNDDIGIFWAGVKYFR
ncbi:MAG: phosphoribosylformylglycinamidine synthase [Bacillota bacterium]|nr:phosphoribosylformylglycinamidine synthase [Bacillota bacterium]